MTSKTCKSSYTKRNLAESRRENTDHTIEARDDTATRQGDGPTEYDGTVQPAVGMEVERSTDGAVGEGRDVAGTTTTGSTDMTATSVGVVGTSTLPA